MKGPVTACADCALHPSPFRLTDRLRLPEAQALSQRERVTITRPAITTSLPRALISKPFPAPRPATHGAASDRVIMLAFFDIVAAASAPRSSPVPQGRIAAHPAKIAPIALFFFGSQCNRPRSFLPIPWGGGAPPGLAFGEPEDRLCGGGGDANVFGRVAPSVSSAIASDPPPHRFATGRKEAATSPGTARPPDAHKARLWPSARRGCPPRPPGRRP